MTGVAINEKTMQCRHCLHMQGNAKICSLGACSKEGSKKGPQPVSRLSSCKDRVDLTDAHSLAAAAALAC